MADENDDLFSDDVTPTEPVAPEEPVAAETGDKESTEPPAVEPEDDKPQKPEKMIPESRFKAALKDATDKLEATNAELAKLKSTPPPDKDTDPDGYDLHIRMEASKAAMRATHEDYDTIIAHYKEMAEVNPFLNDAVAKHLVPAQYAYQLAKEDLEVKSLRELKSSDDWKEFQKWKAEKRDEPVVSKPEKGTVQVPNLNRATNVAKNVTLSEDDDLFKGAL